MEIIYLLIFVQFITNRINLGLLYSIIERERERIIYESKKENFLFL
jgi:hypothetical protein